MKILKLIIFVFLISNQVCAMDTIFVVTKPIHRHGLVAYAKNFGIGHEIYAELQKKDGMECFVAYECDMYNGMPVTTTFNVYDAKELWYELHNDYQELHKINT